jgi:hypothetical protein
MPEPANWSEWDKALVKDKLKHYNKAMSLRSNQSLRFNHLMLGLIILGLSITGILLTLLSRAASTPTAAPGGTYTSWYFPGSSYDSLEWTFVPIKNPATSLTNDGLLHYYAYEFWLTNSTAAVGGGYAGFQTNGIFNGTPEGKVINFSIWGSDNAAAPAGVLINSDNTECKCYQLMKKYNWEIYHHYRFTLRPGSGGTSSQGKWWGLWVEDQSTGSSTFIGQQRVPVTINSKPSDKLQGSSLMFGEDTHWWYALPGTRKYICSDFEHSAMAAINVTANGDVKPYAINNSTNSGKLNTDSSTGYVTKSCNVSVTSDKNFNVQHNLGYWSPPAHDFVPNFSGDFNNDGKTDVVDLSTLASYQL